MICSSIRKYKRLYGDEKAFEIIGILHNKYRKRSAFMDELSKIKQITTEKEENDLWNGQLIVNKIKEFMK